MKMVKQLNTEDNTYLRQVKTRLIYPIHIDRVYSGAYSPSKAAKSTKAANTKKFDLINKTAILMTIQYFQIIKRSDHNTSKILN